MLQKLVTEKCTEMKNTSTDDIDIINIALPEEFIPHGSVDEIYNSVGLSPIKIAEKIKSL